MPSQILMPKLQVSGIDKSQIIVLEFEGRQAISELYHFNIEFVSKTSIQAKQVLSQKAQLIFAKKGSGTTPLNGEVISFTQLDNLDEYYRYKIRLMPKVQRLQYTRNTQVFLDKSIPQVIKQILNNNGISEVELDLMAEHKPKEFIFQYNELDWDFITRWMEFEGLFYYFSQSEGGEELVITDGNSTLKNNQDINEIHYQSYAKGGENSPTANLVYNFQFATEALPKQVIVKSYYYEQSSKPYTSKIMIDEAGNGDVTFWAEHVKSNAENQKIAKLISESYKCKKEILTGISSGSLILPGTIINHKNFKISSLNIPMLIIETTHFGSQKRAFGSFHSGEENVPEDYFRGHYRAIDKSIPYRQTIQNRIPRISGLLPGFVDHEGDDNQVQIDKKGLYKFRLAISDDKPGKSSGWVRKMESYIGDKYSFALPLRKGDEVLIGFQFGNPDLPIILGALSNSTHRNVLTSRNQNYMGLYTKEQNMIFINEQKGKTQGVQLSTPHHNSTIALGTDNLFKSQLDAGYVLSTDSNSYERVGKGSFTSVGNDNELTIGGNSSTTVSGMTDFTSYQAAYYTYYGVRSQSVTGLDYVSRLGAMIDVTTGFHVKLTSGWRYEQDTATSVKTAPVIMQEAEASITFKVGASSIIMTDAGIIISSPSLVISSDDITVRTEEMNIADGNVNIFGVLGYGAEVELGEGAGDGALIAAAVAAALVTAEIAAEEGTFASMKGAVYSAIGSVAGTVGTRIANINKVPVALGQVVAIPHRLENTELESDLSKGIDEL